VAGWWSPRECSFRLGVLHVVELSVSVQHYGDVGPHTAVALRVVVSAP
jgi:hypothetical protein